jgi:RecA/RadA recombinase
MAKDNLQAVIEAFRKKHGDGTVVSGEEFVAEPTARVPWCPSIDVLLSGPVEEGSWVGITGNEKRGKTVASLSFAAQCQRPEHGSRKVFYAKVEGRLSKAHLPQIKGLDLSDERFHIVQSTKDKILSQQEQLAFLADVMKAAPPSLFIIDSISAFATAGELEDGVGKETRGGGAKLFSQWLRLMNQVVPAKKHIVVGITQMICNTSGYGPHLMERGPRAWGYQCDYQLVMKKTEEWRNSDKSKLIGLIIEVECKTSKNGPPGGTCKTYFRFGLGIDSNYENMVFGIDSRVIRQAGAWYYLDFVDKENPPKANGVEKLYQLLRDNPSYERALYERIVGMVS